MTAYIDCISGVNQDRIGFGLDVDAQSPLLSILERLSGFRFLNRIYT